MFYARANGKFLITSEYFVLDGAKALAIPLKFGQELTIKSSSENLIWESINVNGDTWLKAEYDIQFLTLLSLEGDQKAAQKLEEIFQSIRGLNPEFLANSATGFHCQIKADFDLGWGLGSSSTLIWLLAKWAEVDPFKLQFECFGGSGYDIASAGANSPIVYQRWPEPSFEQVTFNPSFKDKLHFVYLGQKQNSRDAIARYRELELDSKNEIIQELNSITKSLLKVQDFEEFCSLLNRHEDLVANALQQERVQNRLFPDFKGIVKSLGAWGGDFVLVASAASELEIRNYFNQKEFTIVLRWNDLILKQEEIR
ncbi:MAG: GHMP kinase [Bacteroidetes bacterium]|nr:GHMP kinase [Bacteroidota bacterium]